MTDASTFSPTGECFSPNHDHGITMKESSENSDQELEDEGSDPEIDGEEVYGINSNDLENDHDQVLEVQSNDLTSEQVFGIKSNNMNNDPEQIIDFENNDHEYNSGHVLNIHSCDIENDKDTDTGVTVAQSGLAKGKAYPSPVVGMEFESYDDAYNFYNCYAKEVGFAIRVKSSWTKRNSKEKRGAVLCCNCEGFKTMKEVSTRRKETRTGCLAMIRLRLVESNRWRVDEVKLEHNHLFDPERAQHSKSHKKMDSGSKRKSERTVDVEVRTIKLYRTSPVDAFGNGSSNEGESSNQVDQSKHLRLTESDPQAIGTYFCRLQLTDPNFFYITDINDEGYLRNVFWIDSRARAAYLYFGDVVLIDTTCLSKEYEMPLVTFSGMNHHKQPVLLGCALLVDETLETYVWLLRAWLTCMSGRPPQTILTDQCKALQAAISEVFPRTHHRFYLSFVMLNILEKLGDSGQSEFFRSMLNRTVYGSLRTDEFEVAWDEMVQHFGLGDHEWFQTLYQDRERWAPVYMKDTFFAGMNSPQPGEPVGAYFYGYVHKETTLKEFFGIYELVLSKKYHKEALDDFESKKFNLVLRTRFDYELQLSKIYTAEIFSTFQDEVELMCNCFSIAQIHVNGPTTTYVVKDKEAEEDMRDSRNFDVTYDKVAVEVRCICSCFSFKGYLCRHALSVLNYNGVQEIPNQYILSRWRKDFKRLYAQDFGSKYIDITNPVQRFDHLYRRALQVVEEGIISQDHYMVAWQAFKESLNKVRLVAHKQV